MANKKISELTPVTSLVGTEKLAVVQSNETKNTTPQQIVESQTTEYSRTLLDDTDAATARTTLGLGSLATGDNATDVAFSNTESGLVASNVQSAIDELQDKKLDISALAANVVLYPTTVASDIPTYSKMVISTDDPDFNTSPVDVPTGSIDGEDIFIAALASDVNIINGSTGVISITTVGNVRRTSGSGSATFYFEVYKRDSAGTETLIGTSNNTSNVEVDIYEQFYAECLINSTEFTETDRVVFKYYGSNVTPNASSFEFQFGGSNPVRSNIPVPVHVISHGNDAEDILVDTNSFAGILSGSDDDVQAALDTLDDHGHPASDVSGLATVATSGSYTDLSNQPTLGTAAATDSTAYATAAQGTLADSAVQPADIGTIATQDADSVSIVGGTVDGTSIGASTPSDAKFSQLNITGRLVYESIILADSPEAYWKFDETNGTVAADSSGNGYDGNYINSPELNTPSLVPSDENTGVGFNVTGTTNINRMVVDSPVIPETATDFSIEWWMTVKSDNVWIFKCTDSALNEDEIAGIKLRSGLKLSFDQTGGVDYFDTPGSLSLNQTYHIVFTKNATTMRFYVNGTLFASKSDSGVYTRSGFVAKTMIGERDGGSFGSLADYDEFAVYLYELSPQQVTDHYDAGIKGFKYEANLETSTLSENRTYTLPDTTGNIPVFVELTQAEYDALGTPNPDTLYIITEGL